MTPVPVRFVDDDEHEEFTHEPQKKESTAKKIASSFFEWSKAMFIFIGSIIAISLIVIGIKYHLGGFDENKKMVSKLTNELNTLNSESIQDAGACTRNIERTKRKEEIIKELKNYK